MVDSRRIFGLLVRQFAILVVAVAAVAAPTGEEVVAGDVEIHRDGSVTWIRASDGAIINFDNFDIFAGEVVQFLQPGSDARVLNRVLGDATRIEGSLFANGIVYIVNPAGIFLDGDAVIEVGGLIASAGTITDSDFLAGIDRFELTGSVVNESDSIQAGHVALLGRHIENHGNIEAPSGTIAFVAGDKVVLAQLGGRLLVEVDGGGASPDEPGIVQTGTANAGDGRVVFAVGDHYSLAINHDGLTRGREIEFDGGDGLVHVAGTLDASSETTGGTVHVLGDRVGLFAAEVDASGATGGGEVRIGGDLRGAGDLPTASRTVIDSESVVRANASDQGDGGSIVVWGTDAAVVTGKLQARGGANGGNGGFAEISSLGMLVSQGAVDLSAARGDVGTLLYDPQDIVIQGGTADGSDSADASATQLDDDAEVLGQILSATTGDGSEPFEIFESEIEGTDANIVLEARNSIAAAGVFDNQVAGEGDGVLVITDGNTVTLRTQNAVDDEVGSAATPGIDLGTLNIRTSSGGRVALQTGASGDAGAPAGITVGDIDTTGLDGDFGGTAGNISLRVERGGDINAGDLTAVGGTGATGFGGRSEGVEVVTIDGDITAGAIDARGGAGVTGGRGGQVIVDAGRGIPAVPAVGGTPEVPAVEGSGNLTLLGRVTSIGGIGDPDPDDPDMDTDGMGNSVTLIANGGALEFDAGVVGPQISTSENLLLQGDTIGAANVIEVDAGGDVDSQLFVTTSLEANVDVTNAGFDFIAINAESTQASFDITQAAEKVGGNGVVIDIDGGAVNRIARIDTTQLNVDGLDTVGTDVGIQYTLLDELEDGDDLVLDVEFASGAVTTGGALSVFSEDGIRLEDGAVASHEILNADAYQLNMDGDDPVEVETGASGFVTLRADTDGDGVGGIRDGAGVAIDMNPDGAERAGFVGLIAGDGIGDAGNRFEIQNGGRIAAGTGRSGDVVLGNVSGGDLEFIPVLDQFRVFDDDGLSRTPDVSDFADGTGLSVGAGDGVVDVENSGGDLRLIGSVVTSGDDMGLGGDVRLAVTGPGAVIEFPGQSTLPDGSIVVAPDGPSIDAAGRVSFDGAVRLLANASVTSQAGVEFLDTIDSGPSLRNLTIDGVGTTVFNADVGGSSPLRDLIVEQDVVLSGDTAVTTSRDVRFGGDLDAASADGATLTIVAPNSLEFGGDVGTNTRLAGLEVDSSAVRFTDEGVAQRVETGAGGILLNPAGRESVPTIATVGKPVGDLTLTTSGTLDLGQNEKLSAGGRLELVADTVRVGDLSAIDLAVDAATIEIRTRAPGSLQVAGRGTASDLGVDWIANTIETSSVPIVLEGMGAAPQLATADGTVAGAGVGALAVSMLPSPVAVAELSNGEIPLDLGIPILDVGNETPLQGDPVVPLLPAQTSDTSSAGSSQAPGADQVLADLRCRAENQRECPPPVPGSPLDTPRGSELRERHARIFGSSQEAEAARRLLVGDPATRETRGALRDLATLLIQARLLGFRQAEYEDFRDALLGELGSPGERQALLDAVRRHGRGVAL